MSTVDSELRVLPEQAGRLMRGATYASLAVASGMIAVKLVAWTLTDSVALLSSLLDSLLDGAASLVNLVAIQQALAPPDYEHQFGHGKAEPLAALGQAAFIAGSAVLLFIQAFQHLLRPMPVSHTAAGLAVMGFAIVATLGLLSYQRFVVRRTGSVLVGADALHYRADLVLNAGVIVSLLLTREFGWLFIDPLFGGVIAMWIIWGAWQVANQAIIQLMDRELPDADRARIRQLAMSLPQVRSVHDLRTRAAGPTMFIQIHVEMDGELTLTEAHEISVAVEAKIQHAFPHAEIIIHQDPIGIDERRSDFTPPQRVGR